MSPRARPPCCACGERSPPPRTWAGVPDLHEGRPPAFASLPGHSVGRRYPDPMSTPSERVYISRLANTSVFDPLGDPVGRVRDVVILMRRGTVPTATGLVVEVPGRRRVFMPLTRV